MAHLDDALGRLQEALDEQDLAEICIAARIILAICGVFGPAAGPLAGAGAVAVDDPEGDALYDPDELGLEPEEFDVAFWRKAVN